MKAIKGPAIFLAQFLNDEPPFNDILSIAGWAKSLGYCGLQIPTWDARAIDLNKAAASKSYCDDYQGKLQAMGIEVVELAAYLQGQSMAIPAVYDVLFQPFYPKGFTDEQRVDWSTGELKKVISASVNMGTTHISVLSGGLAWPYVYPWPQRPVGLVDAAFAELARRWLPVLDMAALHGISIGFELHPGSDLFDGTSFIRFLEKTNQHPAACLTLDASHLLLQQIDYIAFIKIFHDRIKSFHVKDAEFRPDGLSGLYGGFSDWPQRGARFRSVGDGQVDFKQIFSTLTQLGYEGWAILEWECCIKHPEQGAREGAIFIKNQIINATEKPFDDFAGTIADEALNKRILGLT
jgi:sugar phosphate isomerase/epimerase